MKRLSVPNRHRGFNLIEVMVALVVISVGLLGIAKMQALAMSSTGSARMRSMASLYAASLASSVRADRTYWSAITADTTVLFGGGAVTNSTASALKSMPTPACSNPAAPCTAVQMVNHDLDDWAKGLNEQMKGATAILACTAPAVTTVPATCSIRIDWTENRVGVNAQSDGTALATFFKLYVEP